MPRFRRAAVISLRLILIFMLAGAMLMPPPLRRYAYAAALCHYSIFDFHTFRRHALLPLLTTLPLFMAMDTPTCYYAMPRDYATMIIFSRRHSRLCLLIEILRHRAALRLRLDAYAEGRRDADATSHIAASMASHGP